MAKNYDVELINFIKNHPTSYLVTEGQENILKKAGYEELLMSEDFKLKAGAKYYVKKNDSALIAFRMPKSPKAFMICASHSDSPCFKIKENPEIKVEGAYTKLNVEIYGGMIIAPWLDRPLSVAGRVALRGRGGKVVTKTVNLKDDYLVIPNLAIHLNRDINNGYKYKNQKDLLPLFGDGEASSLRERVAKVLKANPDFILGMDLFLYNAQEPVIWGEGKFISSPRLDDVQCAFSSLTAFLETEKSGGDAIPVHAVFDNEEVGSSTVQGAASTFLYDVLYGIAKSLGRKDTDFRRMVSESFMLSADNGHALHPNHPEKSDPVNKPIMGRGVVLKFAGNQKYTTDAVSAAHTRLLAERAGIDLQVYHNNSDVPGGSTLGNISGNQVAVSTADIGIAMVAMHSPYETCGTGDTGDMIKLLKELYKG